MDSEENIADAPSSEQEARGCYKVNLVLNTFVALGLGIAIVLILNVFNRSGNFSLLSGFFGALLYCAIVFPRILFGPSPGHRRRNRSTRNNGTGQQEQEDRHTTKGVGLSGIVIASILALAAGIGLHYLPTTHPIFALISAVLAIILCIALFMMLLSFLTLFLGRSHNNGNDIYFDL